MCVLTLLLEGDKSNKFRSIFQRERNSAPNISVFKNGITSYLRIIEDTIILKRFRVCRSTPKIDRAYAIIYSI